MWSVSGVGLSLVVGSLVLLLVSLVMKSLSLSGFVSWDLSFGTFEVLGDFYALFFLWAIWLISGCVMLFSGGYIAGYLGIRRFLMVVLTFVGSMNMMVLGSNILTMMIGWDMLGVSSFYLVQFYQNQEAYDASMITGLSNRVGDVFLMLVLGSALGLSSSYGKIVFSLVLVVGACTKSAQFPFNAWLPAAMMAPTPVSSLVHSSTLVTAGVYLLIRCESGVGSEWLLASSLIGINLAGFSASFEDDMKKVVAFSTMGHISFMMLSLSVGLCSLSMLHCVIHALGKAGLFISVGNMMMGHSGSQDARGMGWWSVSEAQNSLWCGVLSSLSLMGLPGLSGSVSKELIVQTCVEKSPSMMGPVLLWSGIFSSFFYTLSLLSSLLGEKLSTFVLSFSSSEKGTPALILCSSSLFGGALIKSGLFFDEAWPEVYDSVWWTAVPGVLCLGFCLLQKLVCLSKVTVEKTYFMQSMWFLETVSGQLPSLIFSSVGESVKQYGEGWSECLYPAKGVSSNKTASYVNFEKPLVSVFVGAFICGGLLFILALAW